MREGRDPIIRPRGIEQTIPAQSKKQRIHIPNHPSAGRKDLEGTVPRKHDQGGIRIRGDFRASAGEGRAIHVFLCTGQHHGEGDRDNKHLFHGRVLSLTRQNIEALQRPLFRSPNCVGTGCKQEKCLMPFGQRATLCGKSTVRLRTIY